MARDYDPYKLSSPRVALVRMVIFLVIVGFVVLALYRPVVAAFMGNVGLNAVIGGVLFVGIALAFVSVIRLMPEVRWVNSFRSGSSGYENAPRLLAPMAAMLRDRSDSTISTVTMRSILESIATRLDENRETLRYLTGLLVFLGLLGTFWGLLGTVRSVGETISSLSVGSGDTNVIFEDLKTGLAAPLGSMAVAFSSSLFGLAGSLVLGFLDLQAGQAQNRFYTELEDWLSTVTDVEDYEVEEAETEGPSSEIMASLQQLSRSIEGGGSNKAATAAMANLAEGIQGLVQHMRAEQQVTRAWIERQGEQQQAVRGLLERLAHHYDVEDAEKTASQAPATQPRVAAAPQASPSHDVNEYIREG